MSKDEKFLALASSVAHKSTLHYKHGAVLVYHGKPISTGFNSLRNYSKDKLIYKCCACHAEIDAVRNATKVVHRS
jgi:deoxycytidylate deaminase